MSEDTRNWKPLVRRAKALALDLMDEVSEPSEALMIAAMAMAIMMACTKKGRAARTPEQKAAYVTSTMESLTELVHDAAPMIMEHLELVETSAPTRSKH